MRNHTAASAQYLVKPLLVAISLVLATVLLAPILVAQESHENSNEVQPRGPENQPNQRPSGQHAGAPQGQKYPLGFVANSRQLGSSAIQQKWNQYLSDPRWRALEQEVRKRGYQRAKGEKRLWGYEADVINDDGTTSRVQMSIFDLERGNDGAALIWMQTNGDSKVLFLEVPSGIKPEDAQEWTADNAGNIGRLGSIGEIRTRGVSNYLRCMGGYSSSDRDRLFNEALLRATQVALLSTSAVGCAVGATLFGPFSFAVFLPCMLVNAGAVIFWPAQNVCMRYW